mmetsp:Transcript_2466/g.5223  ORF Transcript_2466/g.5223 Transcript_2466/m.5223 type:complete len:337 (-) Transcript_2466:1233-2243(-)
MESSFNFFSREARCSRFVALSFSFSFASCSRSFASRSSLSLSFRASISSRSAISFSSFSLRSRSFTSRSSFSFRSSSCSLSSRALRSSFSLSFLTRSSFSRWRSFFFFLRAAFFEVAASSLSTLAFSISSSASSASAAARDSASWVSGDFSRSRDFLPFLFLDAPGAAVDPVRSASSSLCSAERETSSGACASSSEPKSSSESIMPSRFCFLSCKLMRSLARCTFFRSREQRGMEALYLVTILTAASILSCSTRMDSAVSPFFVVTLWFAPCCRSSTTVSGSPFVAACKSAERVGSASSVGAPSSSSSLTTSLWPLYAAIERGDQPVSVQRQASAP